MFDKRNRRKSFLAICVFQQKNHQAFFHQHNKIFLNHWIFLGSNIKINDRYNCSPTALSREESFDSHRNLNWLLVFVFDHVVIGFKLLCIHSFKVSVEFEVSEFEIRIVFVWSYDTNCWLICLDGFVFLRFMTKSQIVGLQVNNEWDLIGLSSWLNACLALKDSWGAHQIWSKGMVLWV